MTVTVKVKPLLITLVAILTFVLIISDGIVAKPSQNIEVRDSSDVTIQQSLQSKPDVNIDINLHMPQTQAHP